MFLHLSQSYCILFAVGTFLAYIVCNILTVHLAETPFVASFLTADAKSRVRLRSKKWKKKSSEPWPLYPHLRRTALVSDIITYSYLQFSSYSSWCLYFVYSVCEIRVNIMMRRLSVGPRGQPGHMKSTGMLTRSQCGFGQRHIILAFMNFFCSLKRFL